MYKRPLDGLLCIVDLLTGLLLYLEYILKVFYVMNGRASDGILFHPNTQKNKCKYEYVYVGNAFTGISAYANIVLNYFNYS